MKVYFILGILFCSIGSYAQDIGRQILERELDRNHYDEVLRGVDSLYRIEGESSDLLFLKVKPMKGCCVIRQLSAVIRSGWSGILPIGIPGLL